MDGFSDLHMFTLVARNRSLAEAARELGVTPPSISKRLAQLEHRLGVRLMNRTTRRVSLTSEGELFLATGSRILEDLAELEQLVAKSRIAPTGLLRVNASFGFGRKHIAPLISQFVAEYPTIQIQLYLSDKPVNLEDEGFDVCIRFGEVPDSRIIARLLLSNQRVVCASPKYLAKFGIPATPHDLTRHACLVLRENDSTYGTWQFLRGKKTETVKVSGPLSSNDGGTVLEWVLNGQGVAVRSQWEVEALVRDHQLAVLLNDWSLPNANIHAVYLERHRMSAKVRTFVDFLTARLSNR